MDNNEVIDNGVLAIGNTFYYNSSKGNENKVNGLINYLTDNGFKYEDHVGMSVIYFSKEHKGEEWIFALTEPHEGNGNQWLWRAEKRSNFDRCGNTYFEEKYMSNGHFISYAIKEFEYEADKYDETE